MTPRKRRFVHVAGRHFMIIEWRPRAAHAYGFRCSCGLDCACNCKVDSEQEPKRVGCKSKCRASTNAHVHVHQAGRANDVTIRRPDRQTCQMCERAVFTCRRACAFWYPSSCWSAPSSSSLYIHRYRYRLSHLSCARCCCPCGHGVCYCCRSHECRRASLCAPPPSRCWAFSASRIAWTCALDLLHPNPWAPNGLSRPFPFPTTQFSSFAPLLLLTTTKIAAHESQRPSASSSFWCERWCQIPSEFRLECRLRCCCRRRCLRSEHRAGCSCGCGFCLEWVFRRRVCLIRS